MEDASKKGAGFAVNEFPTLECFRKLILTDVVCSVIVEAADTRKLGLLGFINIYKQVNYLRTSLENRAESVMILSTDIRGGGLSKEMMTLVNGLTKELGFRSRVNDAFLSNYPIFRSSDHEEHAVCIGTIPRYAFRHGYGWEDGRLVYLDNERYQGKTFLAHLNENLSTLSNMSFQKL